jgi:hypothetical protein
MSYITQKMTRNGGFILMDASFKRGLKSLSDVPPSRSFLARQEAIAVDAKGTKAVSEEGNNVIHLATLPAKMRF